jgi:alkanesulfonate monooxygenase SsuD/methylene tetrahydromethanopterin reductase-like flavin-dependent oxidoreductase (luciferase family)
VTVDEELNILESQLRRLKIEYETYFSNPTKKPPTDVEWKVLSLLRKFSDGGRLNFSQRFRYNEMAQRYAVYSDLWRKKGRIREEGYRRPQDALLSVQGVRTSEAKPEHRRVYGLAQGGAASAAAAAADRERLTIQCSDPELERPEVEKLYQALTEAKQKAGEANSGNFDSFHAFVRKKTEQIRKQYACPSVEYTVETQNGQVRLKAKAKV